MQETMPAVARVRVTHMSVPISWFLLSIKQPVLQPSVIMSLAVTLSGSYSGGYRECEGNQTSSSPQQSAQPIGVLLV